MAVRSLLRVLPIYGVLELQIRQGQSRRKANILIYNFYERPFLNFIIFRLEYLVEVKETNMSSFRQCFK
jgi:hypothetical protein